MSKGSVGSVSYLTMDQIGQSLSGKRILLRKIYGGTKEQPTRDFSLSSFFFFLTLLYYILLSLFSPTSYSKVEYLRLLKVALLVRGFRKHQQVIKSWNQCAIFTNPSKILRGTGLVNLVLETCPLGLSS